MYSDTYLNENFKQGGIGDISAQTASKLMKYQNNQAYSFDKNNIDPQYDIGDIDDIPVDHSAPANDNLIKMIEYQVSQLKKESMEKLDLLKKSSNKYKNFQLFDQEITEPKVSTHFLAAKEDRVQAIKHVQTFQKPEYLSLEELQRERREHEKKLMEIENEYYNRKSNMSLDGAYRTKRRTKSSKQIIRREGYTKPEPLDNYDQNFVIKYQEYLAKKKENNKLNYEEEWNTTKVKSQNSNGIVNRKDGLPGYLDQDDYTMYYYNILSEDKKKPKFERPLVTHKHKGKENALKRTYRNEPDYETKTNFYKTGSEKEKSSTISSRKNKNTTAYNPNMIRQLSSSFSKEKVKKSELNRSASLQQAFNYRKQPPQPSQSQLAFIKMIFSMLSKTSKGDAPKKTIPSDMKLDDKMIKELGFVDKIDFNRKLNNYPTKIPNYMNEEEFTNFLLDKGDPRASSKGKADFYLLKNKDKIQPSYCKTDENIHYIKKEKENNMNTYTQQFRNDNNGIDYYDNDLPGMKTNTFDFLEKETTKERLRSLRQSLRESKSKSPHNYLSNSIPANPSNNLHISSFGTLGEKNSGVNFNRTNISNAPQTFKNSVQFDDIANYKTNEFENTEKCQEKIPEETVDRKEYNNYIQSTYEENNRTYEGQNCHDDNNIDYNNENPKYNIESNAQMDENFNRAQNDNMRSHSSNYRCKTDLNFTIPKPFEFLKKDYHEKKVQKIKEILEERQKFEDSVFKHQFRANPLNRKMFKGSLDNIIEREKKERETRTKKLQEEIQANLKPFSFYAADEEKYKEKLKKECLPPQFVPFKANPIKWKSQVNMYDGIIRNDQKTREERISERALEMYNRAKLPPRMEMHEKAKKMQENELKLIEEQKKLSGKNQSQFKAKEIPDFIRLQEQFQSNLEKKKKAAQSTVPKPFTFHEPKKKAELCQYLDFENNPQAKNPQNRKNIEEIIQKMQKKPAIEPATTKGLSLLMETRRKEIEDRKKEEERIKYEDQQRIIKQNRLKERVQKSKDLVDNRKQLEKTRKEKLEASKQDNINKTKEYNEKLKGIAQRVANRPLMLETIGKKPDKIEMGQDYQQEIDRIIEEGIKEREINEQKQS